MQETIEAEVIDGKLAKFQKLNQIFEIAEDTLEDMEKEFDIPVPTLYEEESDDLISIGMLKADLKLIRETLMSNVAKGKAIVDSISVEIVSGGSVDSKLIDSLANLIKATNGSMKELSGIFKELHEIEREKKVKTSTVEANNGTITNTQNNIFVGNASDIMEMLANHKK
jgi:hypothetical protein